MHSLRNYFLLILVFLCSISVLRAQNAPCAATVTPSASAAICSGSAIVLTANSGTGLSYQWKKDNVNVGTDSRYLTVTEAGIYTVTVTGTGTGACTAVTSAPVNVRVNTSPPPLQPDFTITNNDACSGTAITFTKVGPAAPNISYVWDFGDGTTISTEQATITHTYSATGTGTQNFDVSVYAYDNSTGCVSQASAVKPVTVKQQPNFVIPALTYKNGTGANSNGNSVCVPEADSIEVTATLTNNAANSAFTTYTVDWGDGAGPKTYTAAQFSSTVPISNTTAYTKEGTYAIKITATDPGAQCPVVREISFTVGRDPKASFEAEKTNIIKPEIDCGVPVRVEINNTSTGGGLTYKWEITNTQQGGPTNFTFIEGTSDTTKNPVIQFNEKGRYNIKLTVSNPCVDPNDPEGPKTPDDPNTPDDDETADEDGKYVYQQTVLIVYPEVQIQGGQICIDPGQQLVVTGQELGARFDPNTELNIKKTPTSTIVWTLTGGATIDNPNIENPKITFPGPGTYTIAARFENECEASEDAPGANQRPPATFIITERPPKPTDGSVTICSGEAYEIKPVGSAGATYNFYTAQTGGTAVATGASYQVPAVTQTTIIYYSIGSGECESQRAAFTLNVLPAIENNNVQAPQSLCVGSTPAPITGTQPSGGTGSYQYTWELSTTGPTGTFSTAPGVNNGSGYTPPALSQTTWFRRAVVSGACQPSYSIPVEITVVPLIATNTITADQTVCAGSAPEILIGSRPTGGNGVDYAIIWESSTTSATAGFAPATGPNGAPVIINEENFNPGAVTQTTWYRRQVTSAGCTGYSNIIQITVAPALAQNTIGTSQTLCANATPAPLTGSTPTGGTGAYTYLWESSTSSATVGFGPAAGTNNGITYTPGTLTAPVTYFRRVVTSGTCEPNISEVVTITVTPAIENNTITAAQTVVCQGTVPVLTGSTPSGGSGTLVYLWESSITSATAGFNPAIGTNNTKDFTPGSVVQNTWYRRTVSIAGSTCPPVVSNVVAVTIEPLPAAPTVEAADVRVCAGTSATLRITGTAGNTYQWFTSATGGSPVSFEPVFVTPVLTSDITYYVQAVSNNQCVSVTRTPVKVTVIAIAADAGRDTTIIEGQPFALRATGGTTYVWSPATGLNNPNVANPIATPTKTTTYRVTVTTEDGCTATDEVTITVIPRVIVVNTFSPNGDNINETWEIQNIEQYPNATIEVFNRWGNQVFKSQGTYVPWNGTFKGSALPLATYYYIIRLDRDIRPISGSVTIIR